MFPANFALFFENLTLSHFLSGTALGSNHTGLSTIYFTVLFLSNFSV